MLHLHNMKNNEEYSYINRRFEKKVTANGTVTFWERYAYKGYLQIAAFNVSIVDEAEVLSLATTTYWDPTESTATRPLAFTDHTAATPATYFYTHDLTKNVCELLSRNGSAVEIVTEYDYTPFGAVIASNTTTPNTFTFSSEVLDAETSLVYYNYRHYNPVDGRWISRDLAEEAGSRNMLYIFTSNRPFSLFDILGLITVRNTITVQNTLNIWLFWIKFRINFNYDIEVNTGVKTNDCPSKYPSNIKFIAELGAMRDGFGIAGKFGAEGDNFGALLAFQYGFKTYGDSLLAKIWNLEFVESRGFEAYADFQQFYPEVSLLGLPLAKCVCASASLKAEIEVSYGLSVTKTAAVVAAVAAIAGTGGGAATVASASPQIIQFIPAIKSAAAALFVIPAIFEE